MCVYAVYMFVAALEIGPLLWITQSQLTHCDIIPYTAKLSSGKTFAVDMQMTIHGKTFADAYRQVITS